LVAGVEKKTQVIKWLMQREEWDLFLTVYGESHPAGHYLWHLFDTSYPSHPKDADPSLHNALRDVYVAIDRGIGEILKQADKRTTVFLVSGDGMGPNFSVIDAAHLMTLNNALADSLFADWTAETGLEVNTCVPEPSSAVLCAVGGLTLLVVARRKLAG
jgi:predicted AlkP superfamily pyrophosphatase or phosphodiesterase